MSPAVAAPNRSALLVRAAMRSDKDAGELEAKLRSRGVNPIRTVVLAYGEGSFSYALPSMTEAVVIMIDGLRQSALASIVAASQKHGRPCFALRQKTTDPSWDRLENWAKSREIATPMSIVLRTPEAAYEGTGAEVPDGVSAPLALQPSRVALSIMETEQLAESYAKDNEELKKQVANLRSQLEQQEAEEKETIEKAKAREASLIDTRAELMKELDRLRNAKRLAIDDKVVSALITLHASGDMTAEQCWTTFVSKIGAAR